MNTVFLLSKPDINYIATQMIVDQTQSHKYIGGSAISALSSLFDEIPDILSFLRKADGELMIFDYGFCIIDQDHIINKLIHFTARIRSIASNTTKGGISLVFIIGSLQEWKQLCIKTNYELQPIFNEIVRLFDKEGLSQIFKDYKRTQQPSGTFLLEEK